MFTVVILDSICLEHKEHILHPTDESLFRVAINDTMEFNVGVHNHAFLMRPAFIQNEHTLKTVN